MKLASKSIALSLLLLSLVPPVLAKDFKPAALRPKAQGVPKGLNIVDWKQIRAEYEKHRHGAFPSAGGGLEARAFEQQWLAKFDARGFTVTPDEGKWTWGLELSGVHGRATVTKDVNRITYRWSKDLDEWYLNDTRGLEHGFTLRAPRPEIRLAVRGGLVPRGTAAGVEFLDESQTARVMYTGLKVWDADGKALRATMKVQGREIVMAVDDHNARYPITLDPVAQQAYLKASNTGAEDFFGVSMAISGDTLVVGATGEDSSATGVGGNQASNAASFSGAVYVFTRSGTTWSQQAYLKASNTGTKDEFGSSVAISGDTVIVGAPNEESNATGVGGNQANNNAYLAGAAYVFTRSGTAWTQQAYLKPSDTTSYRFFGSSVAVDGDTAVVGAPGNSTGYVFVRDGTVWSEQALLVASNADPNDGFATLVAISGDTVAIAATGEDSNATGVDGNQFDESAESSGAVYVFVRTAGGFPAFTWSQQAYLKASNTDAFDGFGGSLSISGDRLVVGASRESSTPASLGGSAADNEWISSGAAYVFVRTDSTWTQEAFLKASNADMDDQFGFSVAISGDTIVVGAVNEASMATGVDGDQEDNSYNSGAAYVFARSGNVWSQLAYLKASNTEADDYFGIRVAVSGATVAVGAPGEDSSATGTNGNQANNTASSSGATYVFTPPSGASIFSVPAGLTFTSSGIGCTPGTYTTPQTLAWVPGSACTVSFMTPQSGAGLEYRFSQWEDSSTFATRSITAPSGSASYAATFATYYQLTTSAGTGGSVTAGGFVLAGADTVITATPSGGFTFSGFTGSVTSATNPLTLHMDGPKTVTANFLASAAPVITFGAAPSPATLGTSVTVTATSTNSGSPGIVFSSLTTAVCTVSGSAVTLLTLGSCTIRATQNAGGTYVAATPVNQTFTVTGTVPVITFGPAPGPAATGTTVTVTATSTNSGSPAIIFTSQTTPVCTVSGSAVTLLTVGSCTIRASQAAGGTFAAATPVDQTFSVTPGIAFNSSPAGLVFSTTGNGCVPGTYTTPRSLAWTPGSTCVVAFSTPQSGATGTRFAFNHWEDNSISATRTVTAPASPTTFTATFDTQYLLTTATSSQNGGLVSAGGYFNAGTNASVVATVALNSFYFSGFTGAVTSASSPVSVLMDAPKTVTANFTPKTAQVISGFAALADQQLGSGPFTILGVTGGGSGNPVTFSASGGCSIASNGTNLQILTFGTCSVTASQAGSATFLAATSVVRSFNILRTPQSITFGAAPAPAVYGSTVSISATASSGLPVFFSPVRPIYVQFGCTSTANNCDGNGGTAPSQRQFGAAVIGTGGDNWNLVSGTNSLGATGSNVPLTDTGGNTTPVRLSWDSETLFTVQNRPGAFGSTPYANLMSGYLVIHNGQPSRTISISGLVPGAAYSLYMITQGDFNAGGRRTRFVANGALPIDTSAGANSNTFIDKQNYVRLTTSADNSGVINVVYSVLAGEANVNGFQLLPACSVSGTSVTLSGVGNCVVQANQAGSATYAPATATQTFTVTPLPATIAATSRAVLNDGTPKPLSVATVPAGLSTYLTYNGSSTVPFGPGNYSVLASVADPNYLATPATGTLTIFDNPLLGAAISSKADGTLPNERVWTITVSNTGVGTALNARVAGIQVLAANPTANLGLISLGSTVFPAPIANPALSPGQSSTVPVRILFPATSPATRLQIRIDLAADNGYTTSVTLSNVVR